VLKQFKYLNEGQLDQYVAQVEDGLRKSSSRSKGTTSGKSGGLDVKVAKAGAEAATQASSVEEVADTGPAKFERLIRLVEGNEDTFGWIDVLQEADLAAARAGSIVDMSVELFSPDISKLAGAGGFLEMLPLARAISHMDPTSDSLMGLPSSDQLDTMEAFMKAIPNRIVQGEVLDMDWSKVAQLPANAPSDIEGEARVVGKVVRTWPSGSWRPLPGLPIISQMPREQRRAYERKGPENAAQRMMWVEGPALELDILAIYR